MAYTLAIPSNKRMEEDSLKCLKEAGLTITRNGRDLKGVCAERNDIIPIFIDYKDVAVFVGRGDIDFGITTNAAVVEKESPAEIIQELDFSHCRVAFAAQSPIDDIGTWHGKRVVAKYTHITEEYFKGVGRPDIEIVPIAGSAEIYPGIGLADGIVDIVQSGASLRENGLYEICEIMPVQAVLVQKPGTALNTFIKTVFGPQIG